MANRTEPAQPVPATPRDVLGVPVLPPVAATAVTNRLRAALRRVRAAMAPPPLRILEDLFGMLDHRVLVALCEAGVPDALDGPTGVDELAARTGTDPEALGRLLRFAATRGWVRVGRRGRVRPTRVTRFLRRDHPGGWRAWVEFAGGHEVLAALALMSAEPARADPFAAAHGTRFFAWMAEHPDRWAVFNRAMAAGARMHALVLAHALDWSATRTVCDVGGGTGDLLAALLDVLPDAQGTVLDLPGVVVSAVRHPRLTAVAADAFASVPPGFDTYLLVNVLHDWDDDDAGRILAETARAARSTVAGGHARIVVVDSDPTSVARNDLAASTDVLMAALTPGGRERTAAELADLGARCGLRLERTHRLASMDVAHVFRPATP